MESKTKLLDQMRDVLRLKHLSLRTEEAYISWVKRFILFHEKRHPKDMGASEIRDFLSYLATHDHVAASTQNSAFSADFRGAKLAHSSIYAVLHSLRSMDGSASVL